ncbi:hypothetical protein HK105_208286 [Polyrhizophydium stewartii]|uniref:Uncharacterized protein n=1 Tax=Polyrhizophydium stewartii TaxID=2732419 RepID=A0ABR4MY81_9FUNG
MQLSSADGGAARPEPLLSISKLGNDLDKAAKMIFIEKRLLSDPFATLWNIWGVIVGIVLSGEYTGYNSMLNLGLGTNFVAQAAVTLMVACVSASCAEMASAFPFSSASVVYSYAACKRSGIRTLASGASRRSP